MPENQTGKFRKFFGGFGGRDKAREEPTPETETETESAGQAVPEPSEEPQAEQPRELSGDVFAIPSESPLAEVWAKCGQPGNPVLSALPRSQDGFIVPSKTLRASFIKIMREAASMAQHWLALESVAAQARAAAETAARAEAEAAARATGPASGEAGAPAPSKESAPPEEPPAPAAPPAPLDVDEQAKIITSEDGLAAWLFLLPPSGNGKRLTPADGQALLQEGRVTVGANAAALSAALTGKPYFRLCPVALGTPPTEGQDGWTADHFSRDFVRCAVDMADGTEGGMVDYRAMSCVQVIEKDSVICDIHPAVEGTPGVRVDGTSIAPHPVNPASVPAGSNTVFNEDRTQLLAGMSGLLEFRDGCFSVKNLLNINSDVDYSTGNIDFKGDVTIKGDVREQFTVKATGNITINGMVEAATVEAGGDVVISIGVSGNSQAVVRGRKVRAKHLENCTVYAESLESDYILSSRVFCSDSVVAAGSRGSIIGGQIVAVNRIKANSIGSQSGRATEITLGVQPEIREELQANRKELTAIHERAAELLKRATYLKKRMEDQGRPDPRSAAEIQAAAEALSQMTEREKALLARQSELMDELSQLTKCRLEGGTVYPGVRMNIGSASRNIETAIHNCVAVFDKEEMDIKFV